MKIPKLNMDPDLKDILWYLVYPVVSITWLICLTGHNVEVSREPDVITNTYEVKDANIIIKDQIKIQHDTIYIDEHGKQRTNI